MKKYTNYNQPTNKWVREMTINCRVENQTKVSCHPRSNFNSGSCVEVWSRCDWMRQKNENLASARNQVDWSLGQRATYCHGCYRTPLYQKYSVHRRPTLYLEEALHLSHPFIKLMAWSSWSFSVYLHLFRTHFPSCFPHLWTGHWSHPRGAKQQWRDSW